MSSVKAKDAHSDDEGSQPGPAHAGSRTKSVKEIGNTVRLSKGVTEASAVFKMVGDPLRLRIVLTLGKGERGVGELANLLGQSRPAISHRLAILRHGCLVSCRRQGNHYLYSLTKQGQRLVEIFRQLEPVRQPRKRSAPTAVPIDPKLLEDVGGFIGDAERWFHAPNPEFEGRKPIDLLGTMDELRLRNRIEAAKLGMFS